MAYEYHAVCTTCRQGRLLLRTQSAGFSSPLAGGPVKEVAFWWWLQQHVGQKNAKDQPCVVEIMGDHEIDALDYEVDFGRRDTGQ